MSEENDIDSRRKPRLSGNSSNRSDDHHQYEAIPESKSESADRERILDEAIPESKSESADRERILEEERSNVEKKSPTSSPPRSKPRLSGISSNRSDDHHQYEAIPKSKSESADRERILDEAIPESKSESADRERILDEAIPEPKSESADRERILDEAIPESKLESADRERILDEAIPESKSESADRERILEEERSNVETKSSEAVRQLSSRKRISGYKPNISAASTTSTNDDLCQSSVVDVPGRNDPALKAKAEKQKNHKLWKLLYAIFNGELEKVKRYRDRGMDMSLSDYDNRTALHVAAAQGHEDIVRYLLEVCNVDPYLKDRWENTADIGADIRIVEIIQNALKQRSQDYEVNISLEIPEDPEDTQSADMMAKVSKVLYHASCGQIDALRSYKENGMNMSLADYDERNALHLAAAEGQEEVVRFLLDECDVDPNAKDRWNHTAHSEALRVRNTHMVLLLQEHMKTSTYKDDFILSDATLKRTPTDKELAKIASRIGMKYQHLALELGLTTAEVDHVKIENPHNANDIIRKILIKWKNGSTCATYKTLVIAMRTAEINIADVLLDF